MARWNQAKRPTLSAALGRSGNTGGQGTPVSMGVGVSRTNASTGASGAPDDHNFDTVEEIRALAEHMDERWALRDLAQSALRDYVGAVKPRISTSSIFANARATTVNMMTGQAGAATEACTCCGAPRVDRERPACRYCGEPIGPRP